MTNLKPWLILLGLLFSAPLQAQVDEIKRFSSEHSSSGQASSTSDFDDLDPDLWIAVIELPFKLIGSIAMWQEATLKKKDIIPDISSIEIRLQSAIQPSTYYIAQPRIRGSWGLFSTDFRFNYLVEEDIEGSKHIRTNDWQILQLNIVTTKNIFLSEGGGLLHESYSGGKTFDEWTGMLEIRSTNKKVVGVAEYRWAEPRIEFNAHLQYQLFQVNHMHGLITGGVVFQQYYNAIDVWGLQTGLVFKFY